MCAFTRSIYGGCFDDPTPEPDPAPEPEPEPEPSPIPQPPPTTGALVRWTAFPLPDLGKRAPYSSTGSSKHTNMADDGERVYVLGGDWTHSATDTVWSVGLNAGDWRMEHGGPVYPTIPAPHALQDGAGFAWIKDLRRFIVWPGSYFPYDAADAPIREWSRGAWYFDPAEKDKARAFVQDVALFGKPYSSTGCLYGGVYDEQSQHLVAFADASSGYALRRWSVRDGARLPDLPLSVRRDPAAPGAYFARGKPVKIGRDVYAIGYRTNGDRASQKPMMIRVNLDTGAMFECAPPPVNGADMRDLEVRPVTSNGKIVFPFTNGPDGTIHGVHVYTPAADKWATDTTVPPYGNFVANSACSLSDGRRFAVCGSVFGKQQTHFWIGEALQ